MSLDNRGDSPASSSHLQKQIDNLIRENNDLKETNESLQNQFEQIKKEQITYLQNVSHQLVEVVP